MENPGEQLVLLWGLGEIGQEDLGFSPSSTLMRDLWGPRGKGWGGADLAKAPPCSSVIVV